MLTSWMRAVAGSAAIRSPRVISPYSGSGHTACESLDRSPLRQTAGCIVGHSLGVERRQIVAEADRPARVRVFRVGEKRRIEDALVIGIQRGDLGRRVDIGICTGLTAASAVSVGAAVSLPPAAAVSLPGSAVSAAVSVWACAAAISSQVLRLLFIASAVTALCSTARQPPPCVNTRSS